MLPQSFSERNLNYTLRSQVLNLNSYNELEKALLSYRYHLWRLNQRPSKQGELSIRRAVDSLNNFATSYVFEELPHPSTLTTLSWTELLDSYQLGKRLNRHLESNVWFRIYRSLKRDS